MVGTVEHCADLVKSCLIIASFYTMDQPTNETYKEVEK
jgi:hypothetical protein